MTRTRTTRIVTVDQTFDNDGYPTGYRTPQRGDILCLVEWTDTNTRTHGNRLTDTPLTNMSHEARWDGWLGSTNNVDEYARGAYRVVSVTGWDGWGEIPRFRVSLAPVETPNN